jgi:hypothetical protein
VLVLLSAAALPFYARYAAHAPLSDFRAFYCAAKAVLAHADPYRQQPLAACEAPLLAQYFPHGSTGIAVPAPLPGYAFALFLPFALLPYALAAPLWFALLAGSIVAAIVLLRALTNLSWVLIVLAVLCADAAGALALGQLTPLAVLALCAAALALRNGRDMLAVCACAGLWLVPQCAVPAALALFVARPRARAALIASAVLLAVLSVVLLGLPLTLEYVRGVVAAQAVSELAYPQQMALAPELAQLGVAPAVALALGSAVWIVACAAGAVYARSRLAREDGALCLAVAAALGLLGGTYLHPAAFALALPAVLLFASRERMQTIAAVMLVLLAVPWMPSGVTFFLWPLLALMVLLAGWDLLHSAQLAILLTLLCMLALFAIDWEFARGIAARGVLAPIVFHPASDALAQESWTAVVRSSWAGTLSAGVWFARVAAWAGILLLARAMRTARESRAGAVSLRSGR